MYRNDAELPRRRAGSLIATACLTVQECPQTEEAPLRPSLPPQAKRYAFSVLCKESEMQPELVLSRKLFLYLIMMDVPLTELNASPLHPEMHEHMSTPINEWTRERIAIGLLAPDIQKALLTGKATLGLDPEKLLSRDMPLDWEGQRKFLGMKHAG